MSTRSGKRIHVSFHENTVKSDADNTKSERKTRSKHSKENLEEFHVSSKLKKRHYVAYPGDDAGVDTVDNKEGDGKTSHVLRKTALKERNITSSTDSTIPSDSRKSLRSTRRAQKLAEELSTQDNENKVENQKPKKGKKKVKGQASLEEVVVCKKKSKKKKGRRSDSMVVEDVRAETHSDLNKNNMSVDSFHSAAGSPCNTDIDGTLATSLKKDSKINTAVKVEEITKSETRKTRSSIILDTTLTNNIVGEKEPSKRRSSVKRSLDSSLKDGSFNNVTLNNTFNRELRKRKSSVKDVVLVPSGDNKNVINSTFEEISQDKFNRKKPIDNYSFDKTVASNTTNTAFDKDADEVVISAKRGKKRKSMVVNLNAPDESLKAADEDKSSRNTTFEKDVKLENKGKKRNSGIDTPKSSSKGNERKMSAITTNSGNNTQVSPEIFCKESKTSIIGASFNLNETSPFKSSALKLEDAIRKSVINTTYEKDEEPSSDVEAKSKEISVNATFDITECSSPFKSANEVSSSFERNTKHKSVINTTYEKDSDTDTTKRESTANDIIDKNILKEEIKMNTTFEKKEQCADKDNDIKIKRKSLLRLSSQRITDNANNTFDIDNKINATFDKDSKSSLISSDNSMITLDNSDTSRISITSDDSKNEENIINTTPLLIESSLEESRINITPPKTDIVPPMTPLKREGTFTKDEPEVISSPKPKFSKTPPTKQISLPSAGFTPFHVNKSSSKEKSVVLNVTRSLETSRRSSLAEPLPRTTKVMFCSPVNNPAVVLQNRRKIIKSNLKGSNKSFIFDDSVSVSEHRKGTRKRSYTQSDAEDARGKRKRLADDLQQSVDRLSRPRTSSASAKLAEPSTPSKKATTSSKKQDTKVSRTKLPNFAALHRKQFDKMESLGECQLRKAKRARQLLTPTGAVSVLDRTSPKDKDPEPEKPKEAPKKADTPVKSLPTLKSLNPGYTRFGFKLNLDVNPFSIPSKSQTKPKEDKPNGVRKALPSLAGATSVRREVAKQTVMREKSFSGRRDVTRTENRTVIKGVRTNRRFELQMRMRDI